MEEKAIKADLRYLFCIWRSNKGFLNGPYCNRDNKECTLNKCTTPEID